MFHVNPRVRHLTHCKLEHGARTDSCTMHHAPCSVHASGIEESATPAPLRSPLARCPHVGPWCYPDLAVPEHSVQPDSSADHFIRESCPMVLQARRLCAHWHRPSHGGPARRTVPDNCCCLLPLMEALTHGDGTGQHRRTASLYMPSATYGQ